MPLGHIVTEYRNALIVGTEVTSAGTRQEWEASLIILAQLASNPPRWHRLCIVQSEAEQPRLPAPEY